MNAFFELLRGIFESTGWYSDALSQYLQGLNFLSDCSDLAQHPYYADIFLWFLGVNTFIVINYYFGLFNRVPCNTRTWYSANLLGSCIIMFVISYSICNNIFHDIPEGCLAQYPIQANDFLNLGLSVAFWSFLYFLFLTFILKIILHYNILKSINRKIPFNMAKLFLFAIGGTGSRVVKSLAMLLASGVKIVNTETIIPIIIDPDSSNGDLTRTVEILKAYKNIRDKSYSENTSFFSTKISSLDELGEGGFVSDNFKFDIDGVKEQLFREFIGYSELDLNNKSLTSLLFSKSNLEADMDVGFKGNPNIGSVVLNKFKDSDFFTKFAQNFEIDDRVFIISSIFGGTGASGFPLILKNIRNAHHPLPHHNFLNNAKIGAVSILPYFGIRENANTTVNSDSFISKTKAALHYYSRNVTGNKSINALYYIGDNVTNEQEGADGAIEQKNRAHFIEVASALAVIDFMEITDAELNNVEGRATNPLYFEFGLNRESSAIKFSDLARATYDIIAKPLTQYAVFRSFFENHYDSLASKQGEAWASNGNNKLNNTGIETRFKNSLNVFNRHFNDWLSEMKNSTVSFDSIDSTKSGKDIYQLVVGAPEKKTFMDTILKGSGLDNLRNKLSELETKYDFLPSTKKFLALFSNATSEVFEEKINH